MGILRGILPIRREEIVKTTLLVGSILTIVASYTMVKAVRDAVFLSQRGSIALALLYVILAAAAGVMSLAGTRLGHDLPTYRLIAITHALVSGSLMAIWAALHRHVPGTAWLLYIWSSFFGLFVIANFWVLANQLFDARAAKRIFPILGAGAILGGVVGGQAVALVTWVGTINLLPLIALGFLVAAGLSIAAWRAGNALPLSGREVPSRATLLEGFQVIARHRYLKLIALLLLVATVATTLVDLQVKTIAKAHFGSDQDAMAAFFGSLTKIFSVVSLFIQLAVTARFLRRFGVAIALFVLPLALILGSSGVLLHSLLAIPIVTAAAIVKTGDGGLRFSLDKAATELLYVPVPAAIRAKAKPVIDTVADRTGTALTGIVWLILAVALSTGGLKLVLASAIAVLALLVGWLVVVGRVRIEYAHSFRRDLPGPIINPHAIGADLHDRRHREAVRGALRSASDKGVLLGLEIISAVPPVHFPELAKLVEHRCTSETSTCAEIRARALDALARNDGEDVTALAQRALTALSPLVKHAAVRYLARGSRATLDELTHNQDPEVRLLALAYLAEEEPESASQVARHLAELPQSFPADPRLRVEIATTLGVLPVAQARPYLVRLFDDEDPRVALAAGAAAARLNDRTWIRPLLIKLADTRRNDAARAALHGYGETIIGELSRALEDTSLPSATRREIPVILARVGSRAASQALIRALPGAEARVRTRILSALWRVRPANLEIDIRALKHSIMDEARTYAEHLESLRIENGAAESPGSRLLRQALTEKLEEDLERIFRILGLRYPQRDVLAAYYGLKQEQAAMRANALELLDNLLDRSLKRQLLAILEVGATAFEETWTVERRPRTRAEVLRSIASDSDPWLRACALFVIGEANLRSLSDVVTGALDNDHLIVKEAGELALGKLAAAREREC